MASSLSRTLPETSADTRAGDAAGVRDPFFDNAKYLAIVLVAVGHAWEPLPGSGRVVEALYSFVYAFHMPVFIVIAGYFSRGFDMSPKRVWRLFTGILVPYAIFEVAYTLFHRAVEDPGFPLTPADPYWMLWFLPALFLWRITTPFWQLVRWPVPLALAVAAFASMSTGIGDDLQLMRVLQFLPFFVLGLCLRPEHFAALRRTRVRVAAVPVCLVALLGAYWSVPRMSTSWFFRSYGARELGEPVWAGAAMTLLLFAVALVLGACFLAWVPRRRLWMTVLGAGTLYGYLLHGFLVRGARYLGGYDHPFLETPAGRIAVTLTAALLVTALCTPPVRRVFRYVVEPRMSWALRRDGAGTRA
ncbi:acyltransferase family protein [Streptomyces sp. NBC_01498]|uniref:acyltransferase family protein n=1 Tax=Streptomyces sp. NBC_01498 TaxID=2975870 RepID=UPI002E7B1845|nr:acyltransferase family protein [Streptomyces sp. NBC_01498]WTL26935.1 acyltransferase family protein [Streptomyces sp. NBC_01498]